MPPLHYSWYVLDARTTLVESSPSTRCLGVVEEPATECLPNVDPLVEHLKYALNQLSSSRSILLILLKARHIQQSLLRDLHRLINRNLRQRQASSGILMQVARLARPRPRIARAVCLFAATTAAAVDLNRRRRLAVTGAVC